MGFTRPRDLLAVAVVAAALAYLVVRLNYQRMPPLPRFAGLAAALVGIGEAFAGFGLRSRIRPRERANTGASTRKPVPPLTAARAVDGREGDVVGRCRGGRALGRTVAVRVAVLVDAGGGPGGQHHRDHRAGRRHDHGRWWVVSGTLLPGTGCGSLSRPTRRPRRPGRCRPAHPARRATGPAEPGPKPRTPVARQRIRPCRRRSRSVPANSPDRKGHTATPACPTPGSPWPAMKASSSRSLGTTGISL